MIETLPDEQEEQHDTQRSSSPVISSVEQAKSSASLLQVLPHPSERQGREVHADGDESQNDGCQAAPTSSFFNPPAMEPTHQTDCEQLEAQTDNAKHTDEDSQMTEVSVTSTLGDASSILRQEAYWRMLKNSQDNGWEPISLLSTTGNQVEEAML